jgi:hypothetical protein
VRKHLQIRKLKSIQRMLTSISISNNNLTIIAMGDMEGRNSPGTKRKEAPRRPADPPATAPAPTGGPPIAAPRAAPRGWVHLWPQAPSAVLHAREEERDEKMENERR